MLADEGSGEYGSGQGGWRPYPGDDEEDDLEQSGSGSGDETGELGPDNGLSPGTHSTTTDLEIEERSTPKAPSPYHPTKVPANQRPPAHQGTGGAARSIPLMMTSSITILVILLCRLFLSRP